MKRKKRIWAENNPEKTIFPFHLISTQGGFFFLFHALIILLVAYPFIETTYEGNSPWILMMTSSAVVTAIVYTVSFNWRQLGFALCLQIPIFALYFKNDLIAEKIAVALTVILFIYVVLLILPFLLHSKTADVDDIYATISMYILLGMTWSGLYHLTELMYPGSFAFKLEIAPQGLLTWSDFLYFSFVTLTTLGYGDITPVTSHAESLTIVEAITGVMFLGTMVARGVGLYIIQNTNNHRE